ncbi:guanylate kinase [Anaeromassilibacillus senegalensis]|uniref:guanylate kinase n=1 Tax=Anaeromassilibacillus senegalensis TaxID=1673717 RepID=UPI000681703B|nr:guanylate kinase [Anaeromassilibacillus senegalensis]
MTKGLLIVLSGPSGAGKDTILHTLLQKSQDLRLSVSATTRNPREGEVDGRDYFFVTKEQFLSMRQNGEVLESAEYCGNYYGTPAKPIRDWMDAGSDVVLEIEVQGGGQIKQKCPDCVSVFILPPSVGELERRLRDRGTESEEAIQKRLQAARQEILQAKAYDYVVINDTVDNAVAAIQHIVAAEKYKKDRNLDTIEGVLQL